MLVFIKRTDIHHMNNRSDSQTGAQAVSRALLILKAIGRDRTALGPAELARRTGLNRSTVYRLLHALEDAGMVAAVESGRYVLGPELITLGAAALQQIDLRRIALPILHELASSSGETVDLEILVGSEVLIIEEVPGDHLITANSNIGTRYPARCTATGKALLAHLPPARRATAIGESAHGCGPRALNDSQLEAELAMIRKRGYATSYEELESHLHAIGAAILDHRSVAVAAVSVSGPAARMPGERESAIAALVIDACARISHALGYREGNSGNTETGRQGDTETVDGSYHP